MRWLPRVLTLLSSDNEERSILVDINGVKYVYYFNGSIPTIWAHIMNTRARGGSGSAINYMNKMSHKVVRRSLGGSET
jgi:hypothetical protein